ncbi:STAS domain-containing protein [[Mycobacterium] burgundiense]|jgi:anti-anti-sigma factor|uniref:STAS domain-containing protein n=1 Tax=[Mycobacterium] burgundiense TaxID=3064286 RepID=A0ABM9M539_9MYCO|nr:STAS domain-containing protein [Mycolicibacterium sp. MU0053]CAJ1510280.1 STAS domain-containing protein [Mycolicibacterium sp. MU0053]
MEFRTVNVRHRWLDLHTAAVSAHGEIDAANAERFGDYVLGLVPHCKFLVVDLSGLKFLGTQGVSALHRIQAELADTAWVIVSSPAVARALRVCDPAGQLLSAGSVEAALAILRGDHEPGLHLVAR